MASYASNSYQSLGDVQTQKPFLKIKDQPASVRFRYESEKSPSIITGKGGGCPSVQMENHSGSFVILVSLVTADDTHKQHPFMLKGLNCEEKAGYFRIKVSEGESRLVRLTELNLIQTSESDYGKVLEERKKKGIDPSKASFGHLNDAESDIDKHAVCLAIQAFRKRETTGKYDVAVSPVYSEPIRNKKSELRMTTSSHKVSPCSGGRRMVQLTPTPKITKDTSDSESDMSEGEALHENSPEEIVYTLKPTTRKKIQQKLKSKNVYPMRGPVRGRCLLINNEQFDRAVNKDQAVLDYRDGTEADKVNLSNLFEDLGFIVFSKDDRSSSGMLELITSETEREEHDNYSMFVLVILSHGENDIVYGSDGRKVYVEDIYRRLSHEKFPQMKGKPKWIIFQACSGNKKDRDGLKTDNPHGSFVLPSASAPVDFQFCSQGAGAPATSSSDLLILKSSFPGYVSFRDTALGSHMVRALVEVLYKHSCHRHVEDLLKEVRKRVAIKSGESSNHLGKQTVTNTTTLYHDLYLFPGYDSQ